LAYLYSRILSDLNQASGIFDEMEREPSQSVGKVSTPPFFSQLVKQTLLFVNIRMKLVEMYKNLHRFAHAESPSKLPKYHEMKRNLISFDKQISSVLNHPLLMQLCSTLLLVFLFGLFFCVIYWCRSEIHLLQYLTGAQLKISTHRFLESIFLLSQAQMELKSWKARFPHLEFDDPTVIFLLFFFLMFF